MATECNPAAAITQRLKVVSAQSIYPLTVFLLHQTDPRELSITPDGHDSGGSMGVGFDDSTLIDAVHAQEEVDHEQEKGCSASHEHRPAAQHRPPREAGAAAAARRLRLFQVRSNVDAIMSRLWCTFTRDPH